MGFRAGVEVGERDYTKLEAVRGGVKAGSEEQPQTAVVPEAASIVADPILVMDPANSVILEANAAFRAWSGLSSGEGWPRLDVDGRLLALARRVLDTGQPGSARLFVQP